MLPENLKDSVETLPLIEKITNMRSVLMLFVVIFTVDLFLKLLISKNIITYDWTMVHANMHYGKLAICIALSLLGYVLIVPKISIFFLKLFTSIQTDVLQPLWRWLTPNNWNEHLHKVGGDQYVIPTRQLKIWAIDHQDQFAHSLAREKMLENEYDAQRQAALHHASAALILLFILEFSISGSLWFEASDFVLRNLSGNLQLGLMLCLVCSVSIPLYLWWLTRKPLWRDDGLLYYPVAAKERYERLFKKSQS